MESNHKLHIVMAFYRTEFIETYVKLLEPMNVVWHPIVDSRSIALRFPNVYWIQPIVLMYRVKDCDPGIEKINYAINNLDIADNDCYATLNDDDSVEVNVYEEIIKTDDDIIVISMKRGDHATSHAYGDGMSAKHETSTLIAKPENMKVGYIGPQQMIFKGKVFKELQFEGSYVADGLMAEKLVKEGRVIKYRPDLFVLFNYYEPGRWDK